MVYPPPALWVLVALILVVLLYHEDKSSAIHLPAFHHVASKPYCHSGKGLYLPAESDLAIFDQELVDFPDIVLPGSPIFRLFFPLGG
jgi:hypothetical protein